MQKCVKIYGEKIGLFHRVFSRKFGALIEKGEPLMYSSAYVWAKVLGHMEERLDPITISSWLDDAEVVELNEQDRKSVV